MKLSDEALRGRQNEKAVTLGIGAGGRVHKQFYRLIDAFAKFKADADAGPQDNNTDPATAKLHKAIFAQTKFSLTGRIQAPHCGGELMSV